MQALMLVVGKTYWLAGIAVWNVMIIVLDGQPGLDCRRG